MGQALFAKFTRVYMISRDWMSGQRNKSLTQMNPRAGQLLHDMSGALKRG